MTHTSQNGAFVSLLSKMFDNAHKELENAYKRLNEAINEEILFRLNHERILKGEINDTKIEKRLEKQRSNRKRTKVP